MPDTMTWLCMKHAPLGLLCILLNIEFALLVSRKSRSTTRVCVDVVSLAFRHSNASFCRILGEQPSLSSSGYQEYEVASIDAT